MVTWAAAGELPAGFTLAERFAALPSSAGRSFVVSLAGHRATSSALTSYNALRTPRRRLARRIVGLGLRTGVAQPLLGSKIDVGTAAGASREQISEALISARLSELFGRDEVVIAAGAGGGPYRKPVLQVFSPGGSPLGYVKVGWNGWTREAVRREAAALRACAGRRAGLGAPVLLDHFAWQGLDLLVTAPLPAGVRRAARGSRLPDIDLLRQISGLWPGQVSEIAASSWWLGLRSRIMASAADPDSRSSLARIADAVERSHGRAVLDFGGWHGDLVPWNLARLGPRTYAWDWESSAPDAPLGFDAVHFHFQVAFVARHCSLEKAAAIAVSKAGPVLDGLGVAAENRRLVAALHLLELFVRHEEARSSSGEADGRFYPEVARVLERSVSTSRAAALRSAERAA